MPYLLMALPLINARRVAPVSTSGERGIAGILVRNRKVQLILALTAAVGFLAYMILLFARL